MTEDDFQYAIESTRVIVPPQKRLETFGTSILNYYLVTEPMDLVNESRVREGKIVAEQPEIITPQHMAELFVEGFGEWGENYARWISRSSKQIAFLKYGFRIRKSEIQFYEVKESAEKVIGRLKEQVEEKNDPLSTILSGVDDAWEVCLLKFMIDMISSSSRGNLDDFRKKGFI